MSAPFQQKAVSPAQAAALIAKSQNDPNWWIETVCGEKPWALQRKIIESVRDNPRTGVKSCHSGGKSWMAARVAAWFLCCFPNSIVVTTAPSHRQVELVIWPEIRRVRRAAAKRGILLPGSIPAVACQWKIADKWYGIGFSTDDPDRFQGLHSDYVLVIVDEASGIKPNIWEAIEAVMASGHVRLLTIGNPTDPTGPWAQEFKLLPANARFTISAFETPNFTAFGLTPEDMIPDPKTGIAPYSWKIGDAKLPAPYLITPQWVADKAKRWGTNNPAWKARVLGEFPDSAPNALVPLSWIEAAHKAYEQTRWAALNATSQNAEDKAKAEAILAMCREPRELGFDIAHMGNNKTVGYARKGIRARLVHAAFQQRTTETTGHVRRAVAETRATVVKIDGDGIGATIIDNLLAEPISGVTVVSMRSGMAARDAERFANAKAEWAWGLRERFEATYEAGGAVGGGIAINPDDEDLMWELSAVRYITTPRGLLALEDKSEMKESLTARGGSDSPDHFDALNYCFAQPSGVVPLFVPEGVPKDAAWTF